jgi:hypothetical protein
MERHEQAVQIWPLLVYAARMQRILSYREIQKMTGIPAVSQGRVLKFIQRYCERHKLPLLNSLAVNQAEGLPGEGFHGDFKDIVKIFQEQAKVFVHDWFKDDPPKAEDLKAFDD